jgi:hypothetical protein
MRMAEPLFSGMRWPVTPDDIKSPKNPHAAGNVGTRPVTLRARSSQATMTEEAVKQACP